MNERAASVLERTVELARMSHREVPAACREAHGVIIVPLGATEQHGPHLPLNVDTLYADWTSLRAAERAGVVVAPALPYGSSRQNMGFPGTLTVRPSVLEALVKDLCLSLVRHGFDKIVAVNGHSGNIGPVSTALEEVHYETGALAAHVRCWELDGYAPPTGAAPYEGHAGRVETEITMALAPEDVDAGAFVHAAPTVALGPQGSVAPPQYNPFASPISFFVSSWESTEHGHYGDPATADVDRGRRLLDAWVDRLADTLTGLKDGTIRQTLRDGAMPPH